MLQCYNYDQSVFNSSMVHFCVCSDDKNYEWYDGYVSFIYDTMMYDRAAAAGGLLTYYYYCCPRMDPLRRRHGLSLRANCATDRVIKCKQRA